jgi:hypothetical protein
VQNADSPSVFDDLAAAARRGVLPPAATRETGGALLANERPAGPVPVFDSLKDRIA